MKIFEKNILKRLKQGDTKAFEFLFKSYHKKVYNFIFTFLQDPFETENILQDVFLSLWETRHRINVETKFDPLLYRIARNKSLNCLRKILNKKNYFNYISGFYKLSEHTTERAIDYVELEFYVNKFINELPERRREIFLYSLNDGLTYKEIAQKLGISENTVDTQIRSALSFLREKISSQY